MSAVPTIRRLFLIVILAFVSLNFRTSTQSQASAQSITIPPPLTARADRFGVYHWNINDAAMPTDGSTNQLVWGAELAAATGTRTIRIALATRDDYRLGLANNLDLVQLAQHPAYDRVLRDPRFQTILLTTYSRNDMISNWSDGYTQPEFEAERDEIRRLGEYLLSDSRFAGKSFILLNWEGDNAMSLWPNKRTIWDAFTDWIRARAEGVNLARQKYPSSNAKLYSGLEFSQVRNWETGDPCGTPVGDPVRTDPLKFRCVVDYVAPRVQVDYYSYSSWQSLADKLQIPDLNLKQRYKADLSFALSLIKAQRPDVGENNFLLGEYGLERVRYGECEAANYLNEMFAAFDGPDAFRISYAIFWQIGDNAPYYGVGADLFGLYRTSEVNGAQPRLSLLGENFIKQLAGQALPLYTGCPRIRTSPELGVLNAQGIPFFQLNPDSVISIYAQGCCDNVTTPFSATGNTVHFDQTARRDLLPRDNHQWFYESPSQINFSMPLARRPGVARVFVTDARGYDSNEQGITVSCSDCPRFAPCGLLETNYQTLQIAPGDTITLLGEQFSPSGNLVVLEQRVTQHTFQQWTLPRTNLLMESPTELRIKLPNDLVPDRETILTVTNADGRESTEAGVPITQACQGNDCTARLKPCGAIAPDSGASFNAGALASVFGRFSTGGNKIVIEQVDAQNHVYRYELTTGSRFWVESDRRIWFSLPTTLFAGRALLYVVDAQGRESRAQEIVIAPGSLSAVSSANYQGNTLAVESIATVFGVALATTTQIATSTPLPTELAGTRVVLKDSASVEHTVPLFFVSPNQLNFQIPTGTATGAATLTVFSGFGSSSSGSLEVVAVQPGLFAINATGKGTAAAVLLRIRPDGTQSYEAIADFDPGQSMFVPRPIDLGPEGEQVFLALFGTGLRHRSDLSAVSVQIGGLNAQVTYAGSQDTFVGLDQINVRLPRELIGRGKADVAVTVDGHPANSVEISIK